MSVEGKRAEFQAIILAYQATPELETLTKDFPTAFLPIATRPLLSYQLELLEKAKFSDVIVVMCEDDIEHFKEYSYIFQKHTINMDIVEVERYTSSADVLRTLRPRIYTDFVVMKCDNICNFDLHKMAESHRLHAAAVTVFAVPKEEEAKPQKKTKKQPAVDYFGYDESSHRLIHMSTTKKERTKRSDSERDREKEMRITFHEALLFNYPDVTVTKELRDTYIYFFSNRVLQVLEDQAKIKSIQRDLAPFLVNNQFSRLNPFDKKDNEREKALNVAFRMTSSDKNLWNPDSDAKMTIDKINEAMMNDLDSVADIIMPEKRKAYWCHVFTTNKAYFMNFDSISTYVELNNKAPAQSFVKESPFFAFEGEPTVEGDKKKIDASAVIHHTVKIGENARIGPNCIIGEGATIGEKADIRKCTIGRHVNIRKGARLNGSILMDHIEVESEATISNSVICSSATIKGKVTVKDCTVGRKKTVDEDSRSVTID
mmetsp:Transcript_29611/g.76505  ORF Transcript_29611/g.76505 Transcript_29611/m.76505 type:complete len:486 (-) Transcript_29611:255-1712(-)